MCDVGSLLPQKERCTPCPGMLHPQQSRAFPTLGAGEWSCAPWNAAWIHPHRCLELQECRDCPVLWDLGAQQRLWAVSGYQESSHEAAQPHHPLLAASSLDSPENREHSPARHAHLILLLCRASRDTERLGARRRDVPLHFPCLWAGGKCGFRSW